jgi:hypothetical protein
MTTGDLLAALPDPLAEIELLRQLALEAYERGRADGWYEGHETAEQEMARRWNAIAAPIARGGIEHPELEERRWGPAGREHFGEPGPEDRTPAEMVANATASWEPYGLPPPGLVWLSGPPVHHHHCNKACYSYEPGWYTPGRVIEILRTLPGAYEANIAELERKAASLDRGRAA